MASTAQATEAKPGSFVGFDRRARAGGRLTVVFFGASLTWGGQCHGSSPRSHAIGNRRTAPAAKLIFWEDSICVNMIFQ